MEFDHSEYLNQLRRQRDEKRRQFDIAAAELKRLNDAVEAIENLQSAAPKPTGPVIMVEAAQFKGMTTNQALALVMLANPEPQKSRDLADALYRGGQGTGDFAKIRHMVKHYLKQWRVAGQVQLTEKDNTWALTPKGKTVLGNQFASSRQVANQNLFSAQREA